MKNATEQLKAYPAEIQDPAAAAALFAEDGVIELPTVNARAQGPRRLVSVAARSVKERRESSSPRAVVGRTVAPGRSFAPATPRP